MLETIAWISLGVALLSAAVIAVDEVRNPQHMWIMNLVWPITALYFSVFALWAYFAIGGRMTQRKMQAMSDDQMSRHREQEKAQARRDPTATQTALADSHCGAGCVLGDILTEFAIFGFGLTVFGSTLWASYAYDFLAAWSLGIVFQYFTIKPMRNLTPMQGVWAAIKADTLSILAFQVGMYAWMALVFFKFFPKPHLQPNEAAYWLMMQIGMLCGFLTAYPMNRLLVKLGLKEAMG